MIVQVPFKCPICLGCGQVPGGFYTALIGHVQEWTSSACSEQCTQCNGQGLIWSQGEINEEQT